MSHHLDGSCERLEGDHSPLVSRTHSDREVALSHKEAEAPGQSGHSDS